MNKCIFLNCNNIESLNNQNMSAFSGSGNGMSSAFTMRALTRPLIGGGIGYLYGLYGGVASADTAKYALAMGGSIFVSDFVIEKFITPMFPVSGGTKSAGVAVAEPAITGVISAYLKPMIIGGQLTPMFGSQFASDFVGGAVASVGSSYLQAPVSNLLGLS